MAQSWAEVADVQGQTWDEEDDEDDWFQDSDWLPAISVSFPVNLEENMYGAMVYVWAIKPPGQGIFKYSQVIVTTVLFLLTLYIQVFFGWYMIPHVSVNEFEEKVDAVNQFVAWRARADDLKANFTCTGKEWSWMEDVVDEMVKYNMPMQLFFTIPVTQGLMFGVLSMALWVCLLVIELRAALASLSLLGLGHARMRNEPDLKAAPESQQDALEIFSREPGNRSSCAGQLVILGTFLVRTTATVGFGYYGMAFLAYTDNLRDFILNCVALAFVFEIPDLVYRAFALLATKRSISDVSTAFAEAQVTLEHKYFSDCEKIWFVFGQFLFLPIFGPLPFLYGLKLLTEFSDMHANQVFRELCATVPGNTSQIFS